MVQHESGLSHAPVSMRAPMLGIGDTVGDGRFQVEAILAQGPHADVYRVQDWEGRQGEAALKVFVDTPDHLTQVRVMRELAAHRILNGKDGVVGIHDAGTIEETDRPLTYVAVDYVEGGTLEDEIARRRDDDTYTPHDNYVFALESGRKIIASLRSMHEEGVVHCDVTPPNVLIDDGDHFMLSDFGIIEMAATTPHAAEVIADLGSLASSRAEVARRQMQDGFAPYLGTIGFMAPELLKPGADIGPEADVYSTMATVVNIATGKLPYNRLTGRLEEYDDAVSREAIIPASELSNVIPVDFNAVQRAAQRADPSERSTLDELDRDLEELHAAALAAVA